LGNRVKIEVNQTIRQEGVGNRQLLLFWYNLNGRIVAGQYVAKIYTVWDALAHGRTNGAIVWLAADLNSDDHQEKEQALATLKTFASKLYPVLNLYLPNSDN
jgi:EpsI family protein